MPAQNGNGQDDHFLNEHLMENLYDDPYGTTMYVFRQILGIALSDKCTDLMNEEEFRQLHTLATAYTDMDGGNSPIPFRD